MNILGIETSCDETAVAVVKDGTREICSIVSSSADLHHKTGGIVPEVAARKQVEFIVPVVEKALEEFGDDASNIDAVAVTYGPGLIGSLLVGVEAAKALALAWDKPLIPVNHLVGHIYANWIKDDLEDDKNMEFPAVALVVSGGHTDLVLLKDHGDMEFLGGTVDDAAGEAFDKTARLLGLSRYLGGVELSNLAAGCKENTLAGTLPRPMLDRDNYDFSFSGLKTAVRRLVEDIDIGGGFGKSHDSEKNAIAREFEDAVVDVLVQKTIKAAKEYKVSSILLGGGVSANKTLRARILLEAQKLGIKTYIPPLRLCTDNAVYIAGAAYFVGERLSTGDLHRVQADPGLSIMD